MNHLSESNGKKALKSLGDLYDLTKKAKKKTVTVAVAHDVHCLGAIAAVAKLGLIDAILIGSAKRISTIASRLKLDLSGLRIVSEENDAASVKLAVNMVRSKEADILMKGNVPTATFLRGVLDKENGLRRSEVLSQFALFEIPSYHKLIGLTDSGMAIAPDLKTKIAIVNNAVEFMNRLGIAKPKVALLCALETVNDQMPATLDAAVMARMNQLGQIKNCIIEGPLAYDNAISRESARHKGINSAIAGDVDLLIAPNIEAGNILYKVYSFTVKAKLASTVLGASAPIVMTSRSDTEEAKQTSIVMAAAIT